MRVLVDTNVVMDALEGQAPFFDASNQVLKICALKQVEGYLAAHSITNLFYLFRKRYSNDECRDILLSIDTRKLKTALENRAFKDFEDCLQMECAKTIFADIVQ